MITLIGACKHNDLGRVRELLDRGADPNFQSVCGWTALMTASYDDNIDIVRLLLLNHRADPNLRNTDDCTALIWASHNGHTDTVHLLLDHGADPNLRDRFGQTALMYASYFGRTDMVRLIWGRTIVKPLTDLDIFPEGLIREHLTV